jgi:hypothetical protein
LVLRQEERRNLSEDPVENKKNLKPKPHAHGDSTGNLSGNEDLESMDKNSRMQKQKQREIEQQNISPEEIINEEEKRQPQTTQE